MLREKTNFNAFDLVTSLGINSVASKLATRDSSFRLSLYKEANGDVPAVADLRFLGGILSLLYAQYYATHVDVKRLAHDTALGLLSSFTATETCRSAAVQRLIKSGTSEGSSNFSGDSSISQDEDYYDDPNLEDIYGGNLSPEEERVSYAYGW